MSEATTHSFQAEVSQVLSLVINSLYSNREIFLRELVSNASDALDKLRFEAITRPELLPEGSALHVRISADSEAGTVTVSDNGIGMDREALIRELGTIAHSGSKAFLQRLQEAQQTSGDVSLIGQFGVGFYASFLVADQVEVISRAAGTDEAHRWTSEAQDSFTIEPAEREEQGTTIVLHLKEEDEIQALASTWKLRSLIEKYSDYINHTIQLEVERPLPRDEDEDEDAPPKTEKVFETVNQGKALWERSRDEITDEQYTEFYKHLSHDFEEPLAWTHFKIEGTQLYTGLLFIPKRVPFNLFDYNAKHGVRLHVKRVFIMDDCEELLPQWLRFARGVVDSADLSLNVSREILQDSRIVRSMRKQIVKKTLDLLEELARDKPEAYNEFWGKYGTVLKEGLERDPNFRERLAKLVRYESSTQEGVTSIEDYISRMPEGQPAVYYAVGSNRKMLETSPHLEGLKDRGYEVLYMTDTVDQWATRALANCDVLQNPNDPDAHFPLVSGFEADLKLDEKSDDESGEDSEDSLGALKDRFQSVLDERIREVKLSERLTHSPVCLVIPEGGLHAHIERLMRSHNHPTGNNRRILEINPKHPLIVDLDKLVEKDPESNKVSEWIELLYDHALLTEGSPIEDPARFAGRMTALMQNALHAEIEA